MEKVLTHACCAVCSAYCVEKLKCLGFSPVLYFYNPNIYPQKEYQRRLSEFKLFCTNNDYEYIVEEDDPKVFYDVAKGLEKEPERGKRCDKCFELRIEKTIKRALALNLKLITTTLTISPHKSYQNISQIAHNLCSKYGNIKYLDIDFKKEDGFLKTMRIAKSQNLYRQNYCGCQFSIPSDSMKPFS